jgi:hypothetical protein
MGALGQWPLACFRQEALPNGASGALQPSGRRLIEPEVAVMRKLAGLMLMALASPALGQSTTLGQKAVYESSDGRTVLMVLGMYYYLGPRNHPEVSDFVKQYGQMLEYRSINGGRCLSLGVFKLAVIQGTTSV